MDHRYIEEQNIADRYLLDKLSAEERARFEEHFIGCDQCLTRLEVTDEFRRALQRVAAEDAARASRAAPPGFYGRVAQLDRGWRAAVLAGVLVLIALPGALLMREIHHLRHDLDQAKTSSAGWQHQLEQERQTAGALKKELQEVTQEVAEQRHQPETQPPHESQAAHATGEAGGLARPQINTPIFVLSAVRGADPSRPEPENEIVLSASSPWIVFSLELEGASAYENYRAAIHTADHRRVWSQSGLRPNRYDALSISFPSQFFHAGNYLLTLEGLTPTGHSIPVANYPFRVIQKISMR
jgi:hypothetical protein